MITVKAPLSKSDQSLLCKVLREKLVPTQNELEVQQRDPNSPLYSVKSFEELNLRPDLLKGMTSSLRNCYIMAMKLFTFYVMLTY